MFTSDFRLLIKTRRRYLKIRPRPPPSWTWFLHPTCGRFCLFLEYSTLPELSPPRALGPGSATQFSLTPPPKNHGRPDLSLMNTVSQIPNLCSRSDEPSSQPVIVAVIALSPPRIRVNRNFLCNVDAFRPHTLNLCFCPARKAVSVPVIVVAGP